MAIDKEVLVSLGSLADAVYTETAAGANTHERVGQALRDAHTLFEGVVDDEDAFTAAGVGIRSVALADIDSVMDRSLLTLEDNNRARYVVYAPNADDSRVRVVGVLDVWMLPDTGTVSQLGSDIYTLLFATSLVVEGGVFDINSSASATFLYSRTVNAMIVPPTDTGWQLLASSDVSRLSVAAAYLEGSKQDKLTAGDGIVIEDNVISATGGGGGADSALWNVYLFESADSGDSVVTIDGVDVTIAAGTTVQGSFTDDISAIVTHNLKRVIIRGDVSFSFAAGTGSSYRNTTLEEVDMTFSAGFVRSFDYMFCQQRGLRSLRVRGGQPTGAYYMCYYVGYSAAAPCAVDIKGMDFSQMANRNGASYIFSYAVINSVDLSGCPFGGNAVELFYYATVGSVNLSGCTFGGDAFELFYYATVGSVNLSGCTFGGDADNMFNSATVGSIDLSGCTFGSNMSYMFYNGTFGSVDMSGCTFKDSSWTNMFRSATINSLSLCGCDLSGLSVSSSSNIWNSATIGALDLNGVTLPTDGDSNMYFINGMNDATKIGAIAGDFGEIASNTIDLSSLELRRNSVIAILNALLGDGEGCLYLSEYSWYRITDYDKQIAEKANWEIEFK